MDKNTREQEKPQMSVLKHYCKVCHRGFGCAGALGGHMRAHVMGEVSNNGRDDQNFKIKAEGNNNNNKQHSYFLRAKAPRFMGYHDLEDGDYKRPASSDKNQRVSSLMMSPPRSKSETHSADSSEDEDLANCLVMLSNKSYLSPNGSDREENKAKEVEKFGIQFQCKACKKVFNSHQALGGHRASHKKVKGCFAAKCEGENNSPDEDSFQEEEDYESPISSSDQSKINNRAKMHECSVCRRVFSSGQALGGHKRCHWLTTSSDNAFIPNFQYDHQLYKKPMFTTPSNEDHHQLDLNLNLPTTASQLEILNHISSTTTTAATLYLQRWANQNQILKNGDDIHNMRNSEKERDEQMKLMTKLSDLRDVNLDGGWLQMGIASATDIC